MSLKLVKIIRHNDHAQIYQKSAGMSREMSGLTEAKLIEMIIGEPARAAFRRRSFSPDIFSLKNRGKFNGLGIYIK